MMTEIKLTISDISAQRIESAHSYIQGHYELSTQNADDRAAVSTLLTLALKVLSQIERDKE